MWKLRKFTLTQKFYDTDLLTMQMIPQCYGITVWEKRVILSPQCGNCRNLLSRIFGKNLVKARYLLNKLQKR